MKMKKRNVEEVEKAKLNLQSYPDNFPTCWMCWMTLTGQGLSEWRAEPYSDNEHHVSICPLCGYDGWIGRRWFPFLFLRRQEIGNPSSRYRPNPKRRDKN